MCAPVPVAAEVGGRLGPSLSSSLLRHGDGDGHGQERVGSGWSGAEVAPARHLATVIGAPTAVG